MANTIRRSGSVNLAFAATAATMAMGSVMPAGASPVQEAYRAHTALCIGLLFNDKPAHTAQCLPNGSGNSPAHAGGSSDFQPTPVVFAPPPPPVVAPAPEVASSYPEVESSYPEVGSSYPADA